MLYTWLLAISWLHLGRVVPEAHDPTQAAERRAEQHERGIHTGLGVSYFGENTALQGRQIRLGHGPAGDKKGDPVALAAGPSLSSSNKAKAVQVCPRASPSAGSHTMR
jgi:hypothetical protein